MRIKLYLYKKLLVMYSLGIESFFHTLGEGQYLTDELVNQAERLENVEIVHMVAMGTAPYCQPGMEKHFRHNALFVVISREKR